VYGFEEHNIRGQAKMSMQCSLAFIIMLTIAYGRIKEKKNYLMRSLVRTA
jgi:hypothetical protein